MAHSIREIMTPSPLSGLVTLGPDDAVEEAQGHPIGIVTIGDLALERGRNSVPADVSAAAPNR